MLSQLSGTGFFCRPFSMDVAFITKRKEKWERGRYILLTAAALGLMLLRSNGAAAAVLMAAFLMYHNPSWKKILAVILCCLVISIVPGRMILHEMNEEPLFRKAWESLCSRWEECLRLTAAGVRARFF